MLINLTLKTNQTSKENGVKYYTTVSLECLLKNGKVYSKNTTLCGESRTAVELESLLFALGSINKKTAVRIITNSKYIENVYNNIHTWSLNGWRLKGGGRPLNILKLTELLQILHNEFINGEVIFAKENSNTNDKPSNIVTKEDTKSVKVTVEKKKNTPKVAKEKKTKTTKTTKVTATKKTKTTKSTKDINKDVKTA